MTVRRWFRSAITGRWVTVLYARLHPSTTVGEVRPDPFVKSLDRPPIDDPDAR